MKKRDGMMQDGPWGLLQGKSQCFQTAKIVKESAELSASGMLQETSRK